MDDYIYSNNSKKKLYYEIFKKIVLRILRYDIGFIIEKQPN